MDPISIFRMAWRHKLATIPVLLFTCLAALYVVAIKAPAYQAVQSFALINPPAPPTAAQIAANPKLGKLNTANPLVEYASPSPVPQIVMSLVSTTSSKQTLANAGAGTKWQIAADITSSEILDITGVGPTPNAALLSADLVTKAAEHDLYQLQVNQGVNPTYMITSYPLNTPAQASQTTSSKIRLLIGVLGAGTIVLFIAISIAEAIRKQPTEPFVSNRPVTQPLAEAQERLEQRQPIEAQGRFEYRSRREL
jgi:hypothetical protein